jgi:hypothetical protein
MIVDPQSWIRRKYLSLFCIVWISASPKYKYIRVFPVLLRKVSDPDPYWIRIQLGQWIRIRIRNPDPGGQK